ncbi:MAG: MATE family efflux transporter [Bacilli bacterium]|nr:MATE family efflux transporter [Bacilli bacterium]
MKDKLGQTKMSKLVWQISLPMVFSMMLLAAYTVIDAAFVTNMGPQGANANLAITYAFPVQIFSGALGVGTGIGINALLSKSLGETDCKKAAKVVGNGLFMGACIWVLFLIFGLFFAEPFIKMQAGDNAEIVKMGTDYLRITCCLSFGQIGYTVSERFLQSTGKTVLSTISQISGSLINIILDYVFIYPLKMGVAGAAWATVIGQIASFVIAMTFHLIKNKEIKMKIKDLAPSGQVLKEIYAVGWSASIMQGLISIMMLGSVMILGFSHKDPKLLQGSFGIFYKIVQFALFACFGMSNGIITIMSYNYGSQNKARCKECLKYGMIMTFVVTGVLTILFEALANPLALLFSLNGESDTSKVTELVSFGLRIGAISFVFMGVTVSIQGVLQAFRHSIMPLVLSLLRLAILIFPTLYLLTLPDNPETAIWFALPVTEVLTSIVAVVMIVFSFRKTMAKLDEKTVDNTAA